MLFWIGMHRDRFGETAAIPVCTEDDKDAGDVATMVAEHLGDDYEPDEGEEIGVEGPFPLPSAPGVIEPL